LDSRRTDHHGSDTAAPSQHQFFGPTRTRHLFLVCSNKIMSDRPASWRMPSIKQMEKMAALNRRAPGAPALAPADDLPPEYWQALLEDGASKVEPSKSSIATLQLTEIPQHLLRVNCRRCNRAVGHARQGTHPLKDDARTAMRRRPRWTVGNASSGHDAAGRFQAGRDGRGVGQSADYRVLRRLMPRPPFAQAVGRATKRPSMSRRPAPTSARTRSSSLEW
jgi:hypothetical protein